MSEIPFIDDAYINEIIKSAEAYNPALNKTQGIKLRELIKRLRDRMEQNNEDLVHTTGDQNIAGRKTFDQIGTEELSLLYNGYASVLRNAEGQNQNYTYTLPGENGELALIGNINKAAVGLGNVDNTSDVDKPVSLAAQAALATKINHTEIAVPNGLASLDVNGKLLSSQIPEIPGLENFVDNSTDQTIDGLKVFSSSPIVPLPVSDTQIANKAYVDAKAEPKIGDGFYLDSTDTIRLGIDTTDPTLQRGQIQILAQGGYRSSTDYSLMSLDSTPTNNRISFGTSVDIRSSGIVVDPRTIRISNAVSGNPAASHYIQMSNDDSGLRNGITISDYNNNTQIHLSNEGISLKDSLNGKGLQYAEDYSHTLVDRSLIDKGYLSRTMPKFFSYTTSGNGVLTQFSVPHGLTSPVSVIVFPNSPDAIGRGADVNTDPASANDLYAYIDGPNVIIRSRQTSNPFAAGTNNLTWSFLVR